MARKNTKEKMRALFKEDRFNTIASMLVLPKNINFESQNKGEDIYMLLRQHWVVNVPWIVELIVGLIAPFVIVAIISAVHVDAELIPVRYLVIGWLALYLFLFTHSFVKFLGWYFNAYIITSERILDLDFYGLLHHKISGASLTNIEDVSSKHFGLWQNLFDFGSVRVQTAAQSAKFSFDNVPKPGYVKDKILDLADLLKREK